MIELAQAAVSGVLTGSLFALIAVGLTLIWGVMDVVNFAHGNILMLAMYATFYSWAVLRLDPLMSVPMTVAVFAVLAILIHALLIRPVLRASFLSQMLLTFGLLIFIEGIARFSFGPFAKAVRSPIASDLDVRFAGIVAGGPQLLGGLGAAVGLAAIWVLLKHTEIGSAVEAVAQDRRAAQLVGINPTTIYVIAWAITGASLGLAGALLMNFFTVDPSTGFTLGLVGFVVVALGGFGSLRGAMLAGLLLGVTQSFVGLYSPAYGFAAIFAVYLAITFLRPQGIFGEH